MHNRLLSPSPFCGQAKDPMCSPQPSPANATAGERKALIKEHWAQVPSPWQTPIGSEDVKTTLASSFLEKEPESSHAKPPQVGTFWQNKRLFLLCAVVFAEGHLIQLLVLLGLQVHRNFRAHQTPRAPDVEVYWQTPCWGLASWVFLGPLQLSV